MNRRFLGLAAAAAALLLAGCAAMNTVTSEVVSYGDWPAGRAPGSYVFERLPSQQARPERQAQLEAAAAKALAAAGFKPAASPAQADVIVQIGARITRTEIAPWDDPLWWRWGAGYWRSPAWRPLRSPYYGPYWSLRADWSTRYERSVAILLRERAGGTPVYEAHAQNDSATMGNDATLTAMFMAAMKDFPAPSGQGPRSVSVALE
ncbi:MAG: DUF4136 domain-containing protein [Burkholderiales bacterium]|nr:DUF4136 domain-containing protein [Burkholderiales bacterium]